MKESAVVMHSERGLTSLLGRLEQPTPNRIWELVLLGVLSLVAGGAALVFHGLAAWIEHNTIERLEGMGPVWFCFGSLASVLTGSVLASFVIAKFGPTAAGGGVLPTKMAFWRNSGVMRVQDGVVKLIGSALTLGFGVSSGPEGPSVQIGAAVLSGSAGLAGVSPKSRRVWCAAGAAAGIAAVFNAPLAAIAFILEEIVGDLHSRLIGRIVVASVIGALLAHAVIGPQPAFQAAPLTLIGWHPWLILPFVAVLASMGGAVFQTLTLAARQRIVVGKAKDWFNPYRPIIGAVSTWVAGISVYLLTRHAGVFGVGYKDMTSAIAGNLAWTTALALLVGKIIGSAGAVGSGSCGGIFAPSLFIGAVSGAALSAIGGTFIQLSSGEQAMLVMIGMAASLGAVIRTPVTCILLIFEATNQWVIVPALLVAVVISQVVARFMNHHDMYEAMMIQDGIDPHQVLPPRHFKRWTEIPVNSLLTRNPVTVRESDERAMSELLTGSEHNLFPVVNEHGRVVGLLRRREAELALAGHRPAKLESPVWFSVNDTVGAARKKMLSTDADFLCVGDESTGELAGVLTLHDLVRGQSVLEDDEL